MCLEILRFVCVFEIRIWSYFVSFLKKKLKIHIFFLYSSPLFVSLSRVEVGIKSYICTNYTHDNHQVISPAPFFLLEYFTFYYKKVNTLLSQVM